MVFFKPERFLKPFSTAVLTAIFGASALYAGVNPATQKQGTNPIIPKNWDKSGSTQMQIVKNGELQSDGMYSLATLRPAQKLSKDAYVQGVIVVKTKQRYAVSKGAKGIQSTTIQSVISKLNVREVRSPFADFNGNLLSTDKFGVGRIYEVYYDVAVDPVDVCAELSQNPDVEYAEPMFIRKTFHTPNDARFGEQYSLAKIEAEAAWDITKGSTDTKIAIIDSGTDYQHEDLADNLWVNTKEIAGNGVDDDGNGKIDDVSGWDFVGNITPAQANAGQWREDKDPKVSGTLTLDDARCHGTNVAGNAAASTNNGKGMASPSYSCKYIPIKCGSDQANMGIYRGYEAILYAARLGAQIINCSWGGGGSSQAEKDVIDQATAMGSLVVAASGNDGRMTDLTGSFPGSYRDVLNVGASDESDLPADFSNYGVNVGVYAPGVGVLSTMPANRYVVDANVWSGTSFSSPIVSGIAALVKTLHPTWTPRQIYHQIRSTSDNVLVPTNPNNRVIFYGRANAFRAVSYNQTFTSGNRLPGLSYTQLSLSGTGGAISGYTATTFRVKLKNYLAPASNVQVLAVSIDGNLDISATPVTVGAMGTLEEKNVDITVTLKTSCPWYSGVADIILVYNDGTAYQDYERVQIPINISQTASKYTLLPAGTMGQLLPYATWQGASAPAMGTFWAVGDVDFFGTGQRTGIVMRASATGTQLVNPNPITGVTGFSSNPSYAVYAKDDATAYASSNPSTGGASAIYRTVNGGSTWTSVNVSTITGFINGIQFFDASSGIFLGDPLGTKWGIGVTTDAGTTWKAFTGTIPAPLSGETGLTNSIFWQGNYGWFGTTNGRIFYTIDRGQTWSVGTVATGNMVVGISFRTPTRGIAIYHAAPSTSVPNPPSMIASTTDGGKTWQAGQFDLSTVSVSPVVSYAPNNSNYNIILGSGSQVFASENNGGFWSPILSQQTANTTVGAGISDNTKVRIWNIGQTVGYLEFSNKPMGAIKELSMASTLNFGILEVKTSLTKTLTINNVGNADVTVSNLGLSGGAASDFTVVSSSPGLPAVISPGQQMTADIMFVPSVKGGRNATLTVSSDASSTYTVALSGSGKDAASVGETSENGVVLEQNYPNPSALSTVVAFELPSADFAELRVMNVLGETLSTAYSGLTNAGRTTVTIATESLAPGVYFYRLQTGETTLTRTFVVNK